jgi:hypothetical protein
MADPDKSSKPLDDLRAVLDELRLKLHLAGMDLRTGWNNLTPVLEDLEHKLASLGGQAAQEVSASLRKAGNALEKLARDLGKRAS